MDELVGPLIIERVWTATDRQPAYRIRRTTAQLRRIGRAVREGDQAFLSTLDQAMRRALEAALTPQRGWEDLVYMGAARLPPASGPPQG
jgi:hypothetical protein